MFEKEEQRLKRLKEQHDQRSIPLSEADQAIRAGFEKAQLEKRQIQKRRKRMFSSLAVIALLLLTLITSIRVSPAFAQAVASIPGMGKFVELIAMDKGLNAAFQNDYYQEIGETQTISDLRLTIDGVLMDETGIDVFYTIDSKRSVKGLYIKESYLRMKQEMPKYSFSYGSGADEKEIRQYSDRVSYHFTKPFISDNPSFDLNVEVGLCGEKITFSVPFTVPKPSKPSVVYVLHEQVEIEGQVFVINEVSVSPLRVGGKLH